MTTKKIYIIKNLNGCAVGVCLTQSFAVELALIISGTFEIISLILADGEEIKITNTIEGY